MDSLLVSLPVAMIKKKKIPDKSYLREQGFTFTLGSQFSVTVHHRGTQWQEGAWVTWHQIHNKEQKAMNTWKQHSSPSPLVYSMMSARQWRVLPPQLTESRQAPQACSQAHLLSDSRSCQVDKYATCHRWWALSSWSFREEWGQYRTFVLETMYVITCQISYLHFVYPLRLNERIN